MLVVNQTPYALAFAASASPITPAPFLAGYLKTLNSYSASNGSGQPIGTWGWPMIHGGRPVMIPWAYSTPGSFSPRTDWVWRRITP